MLNYDMAKRLMEERVRAHQRKVEIRHLLQQIDGRRRGWFSCQACRLLSGLGDTLVALGRRLQQYETLLAPSSGE